jgi:hypothetical protein
VQGRRKYFTAQQVFNQAEVVGDEPVNKFQTMSIGIFLAGHFQLYPAPDYFYVTLFRFTW